jgi:hypothetical protein
MSANAYIKPGFFTTNVVNPVIAFLTGRLGLSMKGARVLSVQGRRTGEWHSTPVNPLSFSGQRYLVAPRGETQWVRNIRISREARLTLGGIGADASEDSLARIAPKHPVFRILPK